MSVIRRLCTRRANELWQQAKATAAGKNGQAVMEYAIIFFIAGLGLAATLSMLQSKIDISLARQAYMVENLLF